MKKSKKATFFMICFVMVALAFIDGILGVFLPQIKPELGINDTGLCHFCGQFAWVLRFHFNRRAPL